MVRFENSINIKRSIDEVFQFVAEFENVPKWNYFVKNVVKTSDGPVGQGTVFHQIRETDTQDYHITEFNHNEKIVVETIRNSKPKFRREMTFRDDKTSTVIFDNWILDIGMFGIFDRLVAARIKSAVSENLDRLKELQENGTVTLQNGVRFSL